MVTVSHIVRKLVESKPMLHEALAQDIISFANLAEQLKPEVETELGKKTNEPAIIMALRRLGETIHSQEGQRIPFKFDSEITMKTGLCDITLTRSPALLAKLKRIYDLVEFEKGGTLHVIQGNYEITIVISQKHLTELNKLLKEEHIINRERDLVSLTMTLSKDFLYAPGVIAKVSRKLAWEGVNVYENISTMTELIFIVSKKDAMKAYNALQRMSEES